MEKLEDYDNSQFLFGSKGEILFSDDTEVTEPDMKGPPSSRNFNQSVPNKTC